MTVKGVGRAVRMVKKRLIGSVFGLDRSPVPCYKHTTYIFTIETRITVGHPEELFFCPISALCLKKIFSEYRL